MRTARQSGFTLIELMIVVLLIGILAALSAPFLVAAKSAANESSAIGSLKAVNSGQATYASVCGSGGYTLQLATLVTERFASPDVDLSPKSGFSFLLAAGAGSAAGPLDCVAEPTQSGYYFTAEPISVNTGRRGFATTQQGTIWQDSTGALPTEPFTPGPNVGPLDSQ